MTPDPLLSLLIALALVALCVMLFWPGKGWIDYRRRARQLSLRVMTEDALKHLFKADLDQTPFSLQGIAGALQISLDKAAALLGDMEKRGLITWDNNQPQLTAAGQDYAIHIVRAHRLWEWHLAERTGFRETEWHDQAELREHELTPEEVLALSADLGHPTHDPHGDPIPALDGGLQPHKGKPLTVLEEKQAARIVHLEDEPPAVYAQLVAEGLHVGMEVVILEKTPERLSFWADGEEHVLAPLLANNISVKKLDKVETPGPRSTERLSDLDLDEAGRVERIARTCRGAERRRLLDLGLTPGTLVQAELQGPGRSATAYRIHGALIALRKEQADRIFITRLENHAA